MMCKEEICSRFGTAGSWERIDLMCKLLQQCNALELRFIGSCVEDRARKDYHGLREAEIKANDPNELRKLSPDIYTEETRSLINIYMSVLYSINTQCSHILFDMLNCIEAELSSPNAIEVSSTNPAFVDDVLLLYTMAAYHPAFTFHQKHMLWESLRNVENLFYEAAKKHVLESTNPSAHSGEHSISSCSSSPVSLHSNPCTRQRTTSSADSNKRPVYVRSIELKGSQMKCGERRCEFHMLVSWSDGQVIPIRRTYQEVYNFHAELIKLFPKDSGAHKQERNIPFLPQGNREKPSSHDLHDQMKKYVSELSALPEYIIRCDHISHFFKAGGDRRSTGNDGRTASLTSINIQLDTAHETRPGPLSPLTITSGEENMLVMSPAGRKVCGHRGKSPHSPRVHSTSAHPSHKHAYSSVAQLPSPPSSPLPSPQGSPRVSPAQSTCSTNSRPSSPRPGLTIAQWLKALRLHKYTEKLEKFNWAQVFKLSDNDLQKIGLTAGARKKLRFEIDMLKKKTLGLNGVSCAASISPSSSPLTWHTPPGSASYLVSQQSGTAKSLSFSSNASSSVESSPTCSEYSSPPLSPLSHVTSQKACPASQSCLEEQEKEEIQPNTFMPIQNCGEATRTGEAPPVNNHNYPPLGPPGVQTHHFSEISAPTMYSHRHPSPLVRSPHPHPSGGAMINANPAHLAVSAPVNGYPAPTSDGPNLVKAGVVHMAEGMVTNTITANCASNAVLPTIGPGLPIPMGATNISRPSSLGIHMPMMVPGTMASTNVTYSMAPCTSLPPPVGMDVKNVMLPPGMNLISSVGEVSGTYTMLQQVNSSSSSTVTYSNPAGFQPSPAVLPPNGIPPPGHPPPQFSVAHPSGGPLPAPGTGVRQSPSPAGNSASPAPGHGTPTPTSAPTPNSSGSSGCTNCGCNGHCGQTAPTPTYQYSFPHVWTPNPMMPHNFPMGFAVTSNGMIGHNMPSMPFSPHHVPQQQPPPFNMANGITPDVLYNNQTNFGMLHSAGSQLPPHFVGAHMPFMHGMPPSHMPLATPGINKIRNSMPQCHNCGASGHRAPDCKESTMEYMTRSGQYQLKLNPKLEME